MQQGRTISVQQGYELWAATYATENNPLLALQERTLEPLLPDLTGRRVLDVGCGTGRWLRRLAARRPRALFGVDPSEAMLRGARSAPGLRAHLACGDGCSIPVRDRWAEFILCSLALDHVVGLREFAGELSRVAADGAYLLLSEFHPDAHRRGWKRSFRSGGEVFEFEIASRPLPEIQDAFADAGFELQLCAEPCFAEEDRDVFVELGRPDLYESVRDSGPALFHLLLRRRARQLKPSRTGTEAQVLRLEKARVAMNAGETASRSLEIIEERVSMGAGHSDGVDLSGYLLLPGLVNAHDHLEFALFPRLGQGPYANAQRWAEDIHRPDASPVREHLAVPHEIRLWWGGLKNLLSGVTTVHHHNPYEPVFDGSFPVRVAACGWAHSFAFEADVSARHAGTPVDSPFIIHLGEGVDGEARAEFSRLQTSCGLAPNMVVVHGVALSNNELAALEQSGGALVWCPSSNLFMLGTTLAHETVCTFGRMALATDSPMSGAGDMFDEIAAARRCGIPAARIYDIVTRKAADVLWQNAGTILGGQADVIALRDPGGSPADALTRASHANLELVIVGGRVRLISPGLRRRWPFELPETLEKVVLEGVARYVDAPVARLMAAAERHLGRDIRLGHKRVSQ